ncbi:PhoH family protein [Alkalihalobacillus sp. CinArs1]|uniref:PhoH family protein n=1 Tax=Alkalihalobacillus sp. CinArs1 TaxID=2995314 RepID=UPI002FD8232F
MLKTFVLDTNILLHDAHSIFQFGENEVVIPAIVLEEIDSKKRLMNEVGRNAREFGRIYKELRNENKGRLDQPIALDSGGSFRIELNHRSFEKLQSEFREDSNDNRIIAVAINLSYEASREVTLVSNDMLMIAKADALKKSLDLSTFFPELYESDRLIQDIDRLHKGYVEISVPPDLINALYEEELLLESLRDYVEGEVYPQDFIIMKDLFGSKHSGIGKVVMGDHGLVVKGIQKDSYNAWGISPKNVQQRMLMNLLFDKTVSLVCVTGRAGTGKTLLALAAGLSQTEDEQFYQKILISKPVVPVGNDIGFLPGEKEDKLRPWMQPIFDNLEFLFDTRTEAELENILSGLHTLKIEGLTYIRGRSIPNQFIIIDEAQNLSPHEVKTILTRVGEGTKIVLIGDPDQIDHPYLDSVNNGLTYAVERLKQEDEVGIAQLSNTERSSLAEKTARLL